ncbi:HAD domain-containing protein [Pinibacter soli]|uniref:HAD domain-containing protein n=1 Tax=Pinibacter soli TaxID=3044211 RepID=A0ABT6R7N6_9BACT|nr:HAD domain-containing protein [Pinibacter soli]MDI3318582.1 HAD domain-containing protein [Pinibacter soli]
MLTTSHKANYTIQEWKDIFSRRGIDVFNLKALPENINNVSRKDEIVSWVNLNPLSEEFIIIDDDRSLNELPGFLMENLIQTSPYIGLTEAHLENIKSLLSKNYLH